MVKNLFFFCSLFPLFCSLFSCGDGLLSPKEEVPYSINRDSGLTAVDFPTKDGTVWSYISVPASPQEKIHKYSISIEGTRNVIGYTHRRAKYTEGEGSNSGDPKESFDFFSSLLAPIPLTSSFFLKDSDSIVENAFEIFLESRNDLVVQPHIPPRLLWAFPLKIGKEWTVSKTKSNPERTEARKVAADEILVKVPAGNFPNSYLIEERFFIGDQIPAEPTSKYWVAPNAGVVRYEYRDILSRAPNAKRAYELKELKIP